LPTRGASSTSPMMGTALNTTPTINIALVQVALRGMKYRPMPAGSLLRRNILVYGLGGVLVPFPGIWLIDRLLGVLGWA